MRRLCDNFRLPMETKREKTAVVGITYPFRGGISHYTTILARNLRKSREVLFVSFKRQYPKLLFPGVTQYDYSENTIKEENLPIIDSINPLTWLRAAYKIKDFGAKRVIFQWYNPFFALVILKMTSLLKVFGIKSTIICHNVIPHETSVVDRILTKIAFINCNDFLVHSKKDMESLKALKPDANIVRGYHPVYDIFDYKKMSMDQVRRELKISEKRVILFFGYVRKYKGLDVLIRAFAKVRDKLDARLLIVGEFYDDKKPYADLIDSLHVTKSVTIIDRYVANEEVAQYFCAGDVVILPYRSASQSGIVQISYALGKPVIATDAGGLPDVVTDGVTGYVVRKGDADSLADGMLKFYSNKDSIDFDGNIKNELEKYSWGALIENLDRL